MATISTTDLKRLTVTGRGGEELPLFGGRDVGVIRATEHLRPVDDAIGAIVERARSVEVEHEVNPEATRFEQCRVLADRGVVPGQWRHRCAAVVDPGGVERGERPRNVAGAALLRHEAAAVA